MGLSDAWEFGYPKEIFGRHFALFPLFLREKHFLLPSTQVGIKRPVLMS